MLADVDCLAFLPMAMESAALFDALLAFASGHLSLSDESYKVIALETRSTAMHSLARAIAVPTGQVADYETTAAACLGLMFYEIGVDDCKFWHTHLMGTQKIITSAVAYAGGKLVRGPEALKHSTEGRWILRNYAYHDIIGSVTLQTTPLLHGEYLDGITDGVDSCVGVATGILSIISRIAFLDDSTIVKDLIVYEEVQVKMRYLQSRVVEMEDELLNWHCRAEAEPGLASLAYAYRAAALILLYRLVRSRLRASISWNSATDALEVI